MEPSLPAQMHAYAARNASYLNLPLAANPLVRLKEFPGLWLSDRPVCHAEGVRIQQEEILPRHLMQALHVEYRIPCSQS